MKQPRNTIGLQSGKHSELDQAFRQGVAAFNGQQFANALSLFRPLAEVSRRVEKSWPHYIQAKSYFGLSLFYAGYKVEGLDYLGSYYGKFQKDKAIAGDLLNCFIRSEGVVAVSLPDAFAGVLVKALQQLNPDMQEWVMPITEFLRRDEAFFRFMQVVLREDDDQLIKTLEQGDFSPIFRNSLFCYLLCRSMIWVPDFEIFLRKLRKVLLKGYFTEGWGPSRSELLNFIPSFAQYLWIVEYVFSFDGEEKQLVVKLQRDIEDELQTRANIPEPLQLALGLLGCYLPLYEVVGSDKLFSCNRRRLGKGFADLLGEYSGYLEEQEIKNTIEAITPIQDVVSLAVQQQYEENPYPRWGDFVKGTPDDAGKMLKEQFPHFQCPDYLVEPIDLLVAGCGTGFEAFEFKNKFKTRDVLAIDLSCSSLAYAIRKARELEMTEGITFKQADILKLGDLDRRFHLITSTGVIHHLDNPVAGLKILANLLFPKGLLFVALYSKAGGEPISSARCWIEEKEISAERSQMLTLRDEILFDPKHPLYDLVQWRDFYTFSMFRDLIFHEREHRFTLSQVKTILLELDLSFVGMAGVTPELRARYARQFPDDRFGENLDNWIIFESENQSTFAEMYRLVLQK